MNGVYILKSNHIGYSGKKILAVSLTAFMLAACHGNDSQAPSEPTPPDIGMSIQSLSINPAEASLPIGFEQSYSVLATMTNGELVDVTRNPALRFLSRDKDVANVSSDGIATGLQEGETRIVATACHDAKCFTAKSVLKVTSAIVTSLTLSPATLSVPVGLNEAIKAQATFSDGKPLDVTTHQALHWQSADETIASVDDHGLVKGNAVGTTTVRAFGETQGQPFEATAEIVVTDALPVSLKVIPENLTMPRNGIYQYKASALYSDGQERDVTEQATWLVENQGVAVSCASSGSDCQNGQVQGLSTGSTGVSASFSGLAETALLTLQDKAIKKVVLPPSVPCYGDDCTIAVAKQNVDLCNLTTYNKVCTPFTVTYEDGTTESVTFDQPGYMLNPASGNVITTKNESGNIIFYADNASTHILKSSYFGFSSNYEVAIKTAEVSDVLLVTPEPCVGEGCGSSLQVGYSVSGIFASGAAFSDPSFCSKYGLPCNWSTNSPEVQIDSNGLLTFPAGWKGDVSVGMEVGAIKSKPITVIKQ
ncbi:Ig-like domain-containing protein [Aeromonas veronii]